MRVNAVSNYPKQPNFQGLFRISNKIQDETYYEPAYEADLGTYTTKTTIYYYPYADETQKEIDEFVKENTKKDIQTPPNSVTSDQVTRITETVVDVKKPLPITKYDYNSYVKAMSDAKRNYGEYSKDLIHALIRTIAGHQAEKTEDVLIQNGLKDWIF